MDLSQIGDMLGDFETFAKAVAGLAQNIPTFLDNFFGLFETTENADGEKTTALSSGIEATSSLFESEKDAE